MQEWKESEGKIVKVVKTWWGKEISTIYGSIKLDKYNIILEKNCFRSQRYLCSASEKTWKEINPNPYITYN